MSNNNSILVYRAYATEGVHALVLASTARSFHPDEVGCYRREVDVLLPCGRRVTARKEAGFDGLGSGQYSGWGIPEEDGGYHLQW